MNRSRAYLQADVARARSFLSTRIGEDQAVTIEVLAEILGLSRRAVEQLIEDNLAAFDFPLVAGSSGLWVPVSAAEINRYVESLGRRAVAIFFRRRTVIRQALKAGWQRQGPKFVDPIHRPLQMGLGLELEQLAAGRN